VGWEFLPVQGVSEILLEGSGEELKNPTRRDLQEVLGGTFESSCIYRRASTSPSPHLQESLPTQGEKEIPPSFTDFTGNAGNITIYSPSLFFIFQLDITYE
jgi:hypothetical protein